MEIVKLGQKYVVTILRGTSITDAARLMRENHVGDVIVVDLIGERKVPVGLITDRDIVMATVALSAELSPLSASDIMTDDLVSIHENESLSYLIDIMKRHGVKRVPIVNEAESLVGIVSLEDVMSLLASELGALAAVSKRQKEIELERRGRLA